MGRGSPRRSNVTYQRKAVRTNRMLRSGSYGFSCLSNEVARFRLLETARGGILVEEENESVSGETSLVP